jgi:hypothetical protein
VLLLLQWQHEYRTFKKASWREKKKFQEGRRKESKRVCKLSGTFSYVDSIVQVLTFRPIPTPS